MATYTTSLTVQFGNESYNISAEIDSRSDGYNLGRSIFNADTDNVYFLVYAPAVDLIFTTYSSTSDIGFSGSELIEFEEVIVFTDGEASTSKNPEFITSVEWIGNSAGSVELVSSNQIRANGVNGETPKVAVARVKYSANARVYFLNAPGKETLGEDGVVAIVIVAETP